ncbi:MAG: adenosylcobalamin-dependent ribonucleoside-diphosphate reductase [Caulobacteraceae bacterium]|nr:adenosylcobalamin-dependent ribonucleoside-diphosphate reductase [Caulobacteraceae bacterium]
MAFDNPLAGEIWASKYRFNPHDGEGDATVEATWRRVASTLSLAEDPALRSTTQARFLEALRDHRFLPAGRILAGAGAGRKVTLFNCFVMGRVPDDLGGIFAHVREAALTLQQGGGVGMDFSTVRPSGAAVLGVGADASGPLSFMDVWDAMCRTILSAGQRRGAMMGCLRIDHPDIEAFIDAKRDPRRFRNFNLSVLTPDAFMAALEADADWPLVFEGRQVRTVRASELWRRLMQATYDAAEPGVIFIDQVNARNNLDYCETITASNPCGEQMLPPYGACLLGSINLARLVTSPFQPGAELDEEGLSELAHTAVRMLDNVIDLSRYPLKAQEKEAKTKRRVGLGVTGLADALVFCGVPYGSDAAAALTGRWLGRLQREAYRASAALAEEKGAFPLYDPAILERPNLRALDPQTRELIARHGLRNGCLTSIAPTGTTSLLAGNVSSGIEPVFAYSYTRKIRQPDGSTRDEAVEDYALAVWKRLHGEAPPPEASFVSAQDLAPSDHLRMQAAAQRHVDSSISKTINCPEDIAFDAFQNVYREAYALGCKGLTTYRPNAITGSVLSVGPPPEPKLAPRPEALDGATYKIAWPDSAHATYVTINDIADADGRRRPFEIFVNSKNMEHYAWTLGLTRMVSAVFRRGGDVSFVAEELKAVFDPRGGAWLGGRYVPSLLAAIGGILERHLGGAAASPAAAEPHAAPGAPPLAAAACPRCGGFDLQRKEGCDACLSCGYSKCG